MISIKIQPDKLDLLLTEEAKYLKKVRAIREKIYNLKVYRDKIKSIENPQIIKDIVSKYNVKEGQIFDNEIVGEGKILNVAYRKYNRTYGIYFILKGYKIKQFAQLNSTKFNAIVNSRINL